MIDIKKIAPTIRMWRRNPDVWVDDIFGGNIKLSNQQRHACQELGKIISAKLKVSSKKKQKLTPEEERYASKIGLDISSGMGSGKDFLASLLIYFFLHVFPEEDGQSPHVLATANTSKQLKNVLWRQAASIPQLARKLDPNDPASKTVLEDLFVCQQEKIYRKEYDGKRFYAEAVTVSPHASTDDQARALTGRHAPYMLMVLDEAAGLPEAIFTNLEGTLSGRVNLLLMIYNPIKSRGYAIDARNNDRWLHITWNTEETVFDNPALDIPIQNRNKDLLERYGRDSNAYRIRVLGLPPIADTDVFIPWDWVQDAVNRDIEPADSDPIIMGVDPGAGGDNTAIVIRQGCKVLDIRRFNTPDLNGFIRDTLKVWHKWEPCIINVDTIGIGWGAVGRLQELGYKVEPVDFRRRARDSDRFKSVREELWWTLRDQFEAGTISIPNDQELQDQLGNIKIKDYTRNGMILPSKKEMKKNDLISGSPDEADALCLTYAVPDIILKRMFVKDYYEEEMENNYRSKPKRNSVTGY